MKFNEKNKDIKSVDESRAIENGLASNSLSDQLPAAQELSSDGTKLSNAEIFRIVETALTNTVDRDESVLDLLAFAGFRSATFEQLPIIVRLVDSFEGRQGFLDRHVWILLRRARDQLKPDYSPPDADDMHESDLVTSLRYENNRIEPDRKIDLYIALSKIMQDREYFRELLSSESDDIRELFEEE